MKRIELKAILRRNEELQHDYSFPSFNDRILHSIFVLRAEGASYKAIATVLNVLQIPIIKYNARPGETKWTAESVRRYFVFRNCL